MCKIGDKESVLAIFVSKWRRLSEDSEDNFSLSFAIDFNDVSVFRHTIYDIVDYYWWSQLVAVFCNDFAVFESFDVGFTMHFYYYYKLQK